jgi:hypothetical protein
MDLQNLLENLETFENFEDVSYEMKNKLLLSKLTQEYSECNPKLLLSSIFIVKFHDITNASKELQRLANTLWSKLKTLHTNIEDDYNDYVQLFVKWRTEDINSMKSEINESILNLSAIKESEVRDEADVQWNDSIDRSVQLMKLKVEELEVYGKSPPSK